ncbi:hypothetical protein TNCV_1755511 [Trichonephila clavipes]|nr:hypothetical protein TNCV_1755511 [Trichonephila clavipes]
MMEEEWFDLILISVTLKQREGHRRRSGDYVVIVTDSWSTFDVFESSASKDLACRVYVKSAVAQSPPVGEAWHISWEWMVPA